MQVVTGSGLFPQCCALFLHPRWQHIAPLKNKRCCWWRTDCMKCVHRSHISVSTTLQISHTHDLTHILLHAYLVLEHDLFVGKQVKHCIVPCEAVGNSESQGVLFFVSCFKAALHSVIFELIEISRLQRLHCCFSETMMNGAGGFSSGSRTLVAQAQVWGRVDPEFRISTAPFNLCSKRTWSIG